MFEVTIAKIALIIHYISIFVDGEASNTKSSREHVLLTVATRNRLWPHALSILSLVEAVRRARKASVNIEWHIIDDASDENVKQKDTMIQDLVERGWVYNYTKLPARAGTVRVLGYFVDVILGRADLQYWLHCDDDVLVAPGELLRVVRDYKADLVGARWRKSRKSSKMARSDASTSGGGLLAIFVNSWLDDQLSSMTPAFGPYKVAPFLGGASYIMDRQSLLATGNPWADALKLNRSVSPHDAHVHWLRRLLPGQGLPIWIRWDKPYQCQHLGNVNTLNFGRQPDWEAMWAIDHRSKRIIEVEGYSSTELRAALWNGGSMLRDFVLSRNAKSAEALRLPRASTWKRDQEWSTWQYQRLHVNYIEIGTSDFDALIQRHVWRPEIVGISVEPIKEYLDHLPHHGGENKTLLNVAIGDYDGFADMMLVRPDLVEGYKGSTSLCQPKTARSLGLPGGRCLPGWIRGTSSLGHSPRGVRQFFGELIREHSGSNEDGVDELLKAVLVSTRVAVMTYSSLLTIYGVGSVDVVKIDTEGLDHQVLQQIITFAEERGVWPWQVQFEKNMLSDWRALDRQVERLQKEFRYSCRMIDVETVACWRPGQSMS